MKDRLVQLLEREQLSSSRFADIIGVQRSSVSHIVSGRNNPSFDFLQKTLSAFPGLRAEWLLLGKGNMFENEAGVFTGNLFDQVPRSSPEPRAKPQSIPEEEEEAPAQLKNQPVLGDDRERSILQVMILYSDGTFRSFTPSVQD